MASSRVEIASSSPFGCALKDHNRHNRCSGSTEGNNAKAATTFRKNLKELVRDHLHTCISVSSDENPQNLINSNPTDHQKNLRCMTNTNGGVIDSMVDSPAMSLRQVRNLNRWAAKQAREMVSTIEKQSEEAELLIASSSSTGENSSNSADESKDSLENRNLGASSLVQMWEARLHPSDSRLNRSNSLNNNPNPTASTSRTSFDSSYADNTSSSPSRHSDAGESTANLESDSTAQSANSLMNSGNSVDAGERERLRIADIIRKLTSEANDHIQGNNGSDSLRRNAHGSDPAEQRGFSLAVNSPRIRGRQAFNDLLLNMEQERQRELDSLAERQSVSRFPQRGRIQSLLRLRYMRRDNAIQDQQRPQLSRLRVCDANRSQQGSNIMHLRERFSTGVEQETTLIETPNPRSQPATPNNIVNMENYSTLNQVTEDMHRQGISVGRQSTPQVESCRSQNCKENCHLGSSATMQQSLPQVENLLSHTSQIHEDSQCQGSSASGEESTHVETSLPKMTVCEESHHQETSTSEQNRSSPAANSILQTSNVQEEISANSDVTWQEIRQQVENLEPEETLQTSSSMNDWDENEMEEDFNDPQDFEGNNYDWFSGIARPQSYWEERRQAWYREMLNNSSGNNEIRQLLERGTVSNFLASDFRDRMDQLMVSRVQTQVGLEDDEEELIEGSHERMGQLIFSHLQRHLHAAASSTGGEQHEVNRQGGNAEQEECREGGGGEEESLRSRYIEEESPTSHHYLEAADYFDQSSPSIHSPLPFRLWNFSNQHEVADNYEQVSTTPSQWPPPSRASNRDQQSSSSTSHPSIEMELLYDLRGHIEQLQREMFELRKSIQSCVDMQVKLQNPTKQEHLVQGERKNSLDRAPTRRSCCICYEMQVDSFLYRCGHMCTCLRCAHELQWSSGKCPICRAPILDVVRAYMDS